jgi:hypothetical protein
MNAAGGLGSEGPLEPCGLMGPVALAPQPLQSPCQRPLFVSGSPWPDTAAPTGPPLAQVAFAMAHVATHVTVAVLLMLLLELGVETCIRWVVWVSGTLGL